jgi:prefoldin beta subunit
MTKKTEKINECENECHEHNHNHEPDQGQEEAIAQLQMSEQALQNILMQKQAFQMEIVETESALEELKKTKDGEVFKIIGSIMRKTEKQNLDKDLTRKKDILNLRMKSIEKQEEEFKNKLLKQRDLILKSLKLQ